MTWVWCACAGGGGDGLGALPAGLEDVAHLPPLAALQALLQFHGLAKLLIAVAELHLATPDDLAQLQEVRTARDV